MTQPNRSYSPAEEKALSAGVLRECPECGALCLYANGNGIWLNHPPEADGEWGIIAPPGGSIWAYGGGIQPGESRFHEHEHQAEVER